MGAADLPRRPLADKFLQVAIVPANACGDMRGVAKYKVGALDFPRCPITDNFLYMELVRVNAYKCAIFQLPSCISY